MAVGPENIKLYLEKHGFKVHAIEENPYVTEYKGRVLPGFTVTLKGKVKEARELWESLPEPCPVEFQGHKRFRFW